MLGNTNNDESQQTEKNTFQKKRDEYNIEIRKKKRDDLLSKKRNKNLEIDQRIQAGHDTHNLATNEEAQKVIDEFLKRDYNMNEFADLVHAAFSEDKVQQHYGVIGIRKLLSNEGGLPIQPVIDANMVPRLIQFMQDSSEPHLQLEAAWALTNVASGTTQQTQTIIDKGGINCFIGLLRSNRMILAEQAIWALGNISGDSPSFRDMILKCGGLEPLLHIVNNTTSKLIIKHGTWAISNLCRGKPLPDLKLVEAALPTMSAVVQRETETEVITDAMWALSYLTRVESKIQPTIESGVVPSLIHHLSNPHLQLIIPCLRTLGNVVAGNEAQTNCVLQFDDFLPKVLPFIIHKKKTIRREACWVLSNITAGTASQIERIMCVPEYIQLICKVALEDNDEIRKESAWILANATKNSGAQLIAKMIELGLLDTFITMLGAPEAKTVEIVLEGINNILIWGAKAAGQSQGYENEFLVLLENKGGVKKIEDLQSHPNNDVYNKALKILENHFDLENPFQ